MKREHQKGASIELGDFPEFDRALDPKAYLEWERKLISSLNTRA